MAYLGGVPTSISTVFRPLFVIIFVCYYFCLLLFLSVIVLSVIVFFCLLFLCPFFFCCYFCPLLLLKMPLISALTQPQFWLKLGPTQSQLVFLRYPNLQSSVCNIMLLMLDDKKIFTLGDVLIHHWCRIYTPRFRLEYNMTEKTLAVFSIPTGTIRN